MEEKTKGCVTMRKYIIGALIGFSLSFAISAHAAVENLIGRVVEGVFPVKVNGVQIEKQAIVIDGTSYLPVRAIGDALGLDVTFDADLGIGLTQKKVGGVMPTQQPTETQKIKPLILNKIKNSMSKVSLKDGGNFALIELDGNQYVSLVSLAGQYVIDWEIPNAIFHNEGQPDITVSISDAYQPNIDGFFIGGTAYVKLSIFGLKAHVDGDTLVIEKQ